MQPRVAWGREPCGVQGRAELLVWMRSVLCICLISLDIALVG